MAAHAPSRPGTDTQTLDTLYSGSMGAAMVGMVEALVLSGLFWGDVSAVALAIWLAAFLVIRLARIGLGRVYARAQPVPAASQGQWRRALVASAAVQSLAWGLGSWVLVAPANLMAEWALHIGLAAVALGGATRLAPLRAAFMAYVLGIFAPLLARDLWLGGASHLLLAGVTLLLAAYVVYAGNARSAAASEAARQRQRNAELMTALQSENAARVLAQQHAEAAHTAKSRFLSAISHDLRQPLNAMRLLSHTLRHQARDGNVQALALNMTDCTTHMTDLVDALLEQSRLEALALQPEHQAFPLGPLLQEIDNTQRPLAQERQLDFSVAATDAVVLSDRRLLARVLSNLVSNAIRYTDQGAVTVRATPEGERLHIHVQDTGRGIAAAELPHIFDEFYTVDEGSHSSTGLGLGLANVRRLSDLLGLQLQVASNLGQGSTFGFSVPLGNLTSEDPSTTAVAEPRNLLNGLHVLVVEDDTHARDAMQAQLQAWGCRVTTAANGPDALTCVAAGLRPQAVVVDLHLGPDMNGWALIQALYERPVSETFAALLVTAAPDHPLALEAATSVAVLPKPIHPMRLRAFLASVASGQAQHD